MGNRLKLPTVSLLPEEALSHGLRARAWTAFWGVPSGPIGWLGAHLLQRSAQPQYEVMLQELDLKPEDELLDVGCGSGVLLAQASAARRVAGVDASELQLGMARGRLRDRIAAGRAEVVLGDAQALPWEDDSFTAVCSLNCVKFLPDPQQALQEMHRVLRPGGRVVLTVDEFVTEPGTSGTIDALGQWVWNEDELCQYMTQAGFGEVSATRFPVERVKLQLVRGVASA